MAHNLNAKLLLEGRHVALDDVIGGDLQMHADDVGPDRLLADIYSI
ncbi:hypothetical protein HNR03_003399 [Pseudomonas sp. JAI111]|nr:hypothetical protein [Pseudomonas sp. JAI111]QZP31710.1 hypothetical protein K5K95_26650 [Pseudomonas sp. DR48]